MRGGRAAGQTTVLAGLRARVHAIERRGGGLLPCIPPPPLSGGVEPAARLAGPAYGPGTAGPASAWALGAAEIDALLPAGGLAADAIHEIRPAAHGDTWAALLFSLLLAARHARSGVGGGAPLLWCQPATFAAEQGAPYAPGLAVLGLAPEAIVLVEPRREGEALWVMEEALKSRALALVIGFARKVALTPARRLALAARQGGTPCLLITPYGAPPAAATETRWRVKAAPGAPHPFDPAAPGPPRLEVLLERCRSHLECLPFILEWRDETHGFRVAAPLADRASGPGRAQGAR